MTAFTVWYTGTDTNVAIPFPTRAGVQGEHFYIGRLGGEVQADAYGFDIQAAKQATRTFGYWDLAGPGSPSRTPHTTPQAWGHAQGQAFIAAWRAKSRVTGQTLFLDIESGNGGWGSDVSANRLVLEGALLALTAVAEPGIYISESFWQQCFGSWAPGPFVLFLAGVNYAGIDCPTLEEAMAHWNGLPAISGMVPMIWQFRLPGCSGQTQDWDLTPYGGWLQDGRWKPTPVTMPETLVEQALATLNTAVKELQQAIAAVEKLR